MFIKLSWYGARCCSNKVLITTERESGRILVTCCRRGHNGLSCPTSGKHVLIISLISQNKTRKVDLILAFKCFQYSMFALSRGLILCIILTLKSKSSTHSRLNTQHNLLRELAGLLNRCLNPIWRMLTGQLWIDYWCNYKQNHCLLVSLANM